MDADKPSAGTTENNQEPNPEANPEPKSGNLPLRVGVVFAVFFLAASAGMTALTLGGGPAFLTPAVRQPLAFNHLKHVKDLDLALGDPELRGNLHQKDGQQLAALVLERLVLFGS